MSYLGEHGHPSTYEVGCNGCDRKVKGEEPPPTWETDTDVIPEEHYCPRCRRKRGEREGRGR